MSHRDEIGERQVEPPRAAGDDDARADGARREPSVRREPGRRDGAPRAGLRRDDARRGDGERPRPSFNLWWVLLGALLLGQAFWGWLAPAGKPVPYSDFEAWLDAGRVTDVHVSDDAISGTLKDPKDDEPEHFVTVRVDPELADRLQEKGVEFTGVVRDTFFGQLLSWLLPVLLLFALWMFVLRRMMGGAGGGPGGVLSFGKSKARIYAEESVKVTFDDVAGVDEAKEELREVIGFLKEPERYGRLGGRLPKGILLVGPPGTGKTLLARAVAGEAGVPFFSISGSEFVELFVGVGASRVRDLFEQARAKAPCLIFIDELDALGRARGIGPMTGGHDEKEQTLNQLLAELDGFDPRQGVVLLAATNRPEILDSALLRAGRFDRQILVDRPDRRGREAILVVHVRTVTLAPDVSIEDVAALTPGFSGADLANLVNEAAILATRRGADAVGALDFTAALERIVAGLEKKSRLLNPLERRVTAYHEMGHALVARALPGADPVYKVSIIPRGIGALGYTIQRPVEDRFLVTRTELDARMAVMLGGRTAEELVFGEVSTGASDDLRRCTDLARAMVTRFGMHETLGLVSYDDEPPALLDVPRQAFGRRDFSEETAREIDCAVRQLVDQAHARARAVLEKNREALERGAEMLLERETLGGDELPVVVGDG